MILVYVDDCLVGSTDDSENDKLVKKSNMKNECELTDFKDFLCFEIVQKQEEHIITLGVTFGSKHVRVLTSINICTNKSQHLRR